MSLKDIFCQDRAVSLLQKAFAAGKVPHAYIFAGRQGVGKYTTSLEWARLLLCKNPAVEDDAGSADSCGSCESCRALAVDAHPDFSHIYKELVKFTREGKEKKTPVDLPVDVIREFLVEKVSAKPTVSDRKVFIVSEAERLNAASQNCLLKVLEEPPTHCCIILLCTRLERLLPTTRSRCQTIRFGPIDEGTIFKKVRSIGIEEGAARYFSRLAQGSVGLACRWAELERSGAKLYETKRALVALAGGFEYSQIVDLAEQLLGKSNNLAAAWADLEPGTSKTDINRRAAKSIVTMLIAALYDAMKLGVAEHYEPINFDQAEQIGRLGGRLDAEQLAGRIADCYRLLGWIESGVNEKLIFEQMLFSLAKSDTIRG